MGLRVLGLQLDLLPVIGQRALVIARGPRDICEVEVRVLVL